MFKTETHLHVSEVSLCSKIAAADMVKLYHDAGYKTLIISDHFHKGYFNTLVDLSWNGKVDRFLFGYQSAKEAGEKLGMNILLSAEITFNNQRNDYLVYGIDEALLKTYPELFAMSVEDFYSFAKKHGLTVVQAHPYRDNYCYPTPEYVDGIEVYNSNPRHEDFEKKATQMAKDYNKAITAGSDAHRLEDVTLSGVMTQTEIRTIDDYVEALLSGNLTIIKAGD